jgi:hypothetical protein
MQARGIPQEYWDTFRVVVFSMSGPVFLPFTTLILLYLDLRGSVLIISSVFLATNLRPEIRGSDHLARPPILWLRLPGLIDY